MAKNRVEILPYDTEIEVIAIKGKEVFKKVMSYEKALNLPKKKGFYYYYYQLGFSQFSH